MERNKSHPTFGSSEAQAFVVALVPHSGRSLAIVSGDIGDVHDGERIDKCVEFVLEIFDNWATQ